MKSSPRHSQVRFQVVALIFVVAAPIVLLSVYTSLQQREAAALGAREDTYRLARLMAVEDITLADSAHQLLVALTLTSDVLSRDADACNRYLAHLLAQYPRYDNFGLVLPDGSLICSALPFNAPLSLADRPWFQAALATRDFAVGGYQIGRVTGKPGAVMAQPILEDDQHVQAILYATLNLDWLEHFLASAQLPPGSTIAIIDGAGTILARQPDAEHQRGQALTETKLVAAILAQPKGGVVELAGADGLARVYGFEPLHQDVAGSAFVVIGVPAAEVYAEADKALWTTLIGLAAVVGVATPAALYLATRTVIKQVGRLVKATQALAHGDLQARTDLDETAGELGQLGQAFDRMAAALEQRERDRDQAEAALRASESLNSSVLASLSEHVAVINAAGQVESVNAAWSQFTAQHGAGQAPEPVVGGNYLDGLRQAADAGDPLAKIVLRGVQLVRAGDQLQFDLEHPYPASAPACWLALHVRPLSNRPGCVVVVREDITSAQQSKEALRRYKLLFENTHDLILFVRAADGHILEANPAAQRAYGYNLDELRALTIRDLRDPATTAALASQMHQADHGGAYFETVHRRKDGAPMPVEVSSTGAVIGGERVLVSIIRDVTERQRAAASLRQLSRAVEQSPASIVITDTRGVIEYVNPRFTQATGYTLDEVRGQNPRVLKSGETSPEEYRRLWQTITGGGEWRGEFHNRRKSGELFWESASISPVFDAEGVITHFVAVKEDITERKAVEARLRESEAQYRRLAENAPDLIYRYRYLPTHGFEYVSAAASALTGYTPEAFYADPELGSKLVHPDDRSTPQPVSETPGQPVTVRWVRRDGRVIWTEQRNVLLYNPAGQLEAIEGIARDITERKQREYELETLAAVGAALRIAHDRAEMLPILLDQALTLFQASGAAIALHDAAADEAHIALGRGAWAHQTGRRLNLASDINGHLLHTRQPIVSADVRGDPRFTRTDLLNGLYAVIGAPLLVDDIAIGAIWLGCASAFEDAEVRLLTAVADLAANALHRAALHEQTLRGLSQLRSLRQIDQAIATSLDLSFTMTVLLEQATAQLTVAGAAVLVFNPYSHVLEYAARRGLSGHYLPDRAVALGEGPAGQAALERRLVYVPDPAPHDSPAGLGGQRFAAYYAVPLTAKGQVKGVLELFLKSKSQANPEWLNFLEMLAGQAAIAIEDAQLFDGLQRSNVELAQAYDATIEGWSRALDLRDKETEGHSRRVTEMTLRLARALGLGEAELVHLRRGALLHDIGKMGIPDAILLKPGPLTDDEWALMKLHPALANDMLSPIAFLRPALDIPHYHHEKWDGSGYPHGLAGEQIPLAARIFAVADVWDALSSDRPYRPAWSADKVRQYIRAESGRHFDPQIVDVFLKLASPY